MDNAIKTAEDLIVYAARVSNPANQENTNTGPKLLAYCMTNGHWSVFEQASFTVEIKTSRAIAAQILRHRSFTFQEFSQRYAVVEEMEPVELRRQGTKNRQGGEEIMDDPHLIKSVEQATKQSMSIYKSLIDQGVSKESARMILPLTVQTTLYMNGTVRSWIHYLRQRLDMHAQKEHRLIAEEIKKIFNTQFPNIPL